MRFGLVDHPFFPTSLFPTPSILTLLVTGRLAFPRHSHKREHAAAVPFLLTHFSFAAQCQFADAACCRLLALRRDSDHTKLAWFALMRQIVASIPSTHDRKNWSHATLLIAGRTQPVPHRQKETSDCGSPMTEVTT